MPLHLLTQEAFELYRNKMTPDGFIAVNASSFIWDLNRILCTQGQTVNLRCSDYAPQDEQSLKYRDEWVILQPASRITASESVWKNIEYTPLARTWTDDFTHPAGAIRMPRFSLIKDHVHHGVPWMQGPR